MSTQYVLDGEVRYFRRPTASTLLFSLAKQVAKAEKRGEIIDFALIQYAPCEEDGDYVGKIFVQPGWSE